MGRDLGMSGDDWSWVLSVGIVSLLIAFLTFSAVLNNMSTRRHDREMAKIGLAVSQYQVPLPEPAEVEGVVEKGGE